MRSKLSRLNRRYGPLLLLDMSTGSNVHPKHSIDGKMINKNNDNSIYTTGLRAPFVINPLSSSTVLVLSLSRYRQPRRSVNVTDVLNKNIPFCYPANYIQHRPCRKARYTLMYEGSGAIVTQTMTQHANGYLTSMLR